MATGMKYDFKAIAKDIISRFNLSDDEIEELAVELLKQRQQRQLLEKSGSVASGAFSGSLSYCGSCGRPL